MDTQKVTQEYRMNQWMGIVRECRESGQTVISWYKKILLLASENTRGSL